MIDSHIQNKYDRSLGEILSSQRKEHNLTLNEVQKMLNIRKIYLEALESGDFKKLPSDIYTKCFIKSYSKILSLDGDDLVELYLHEKSLFQKENPFETKYILKSKNKDIKFHHFLVIPKIIKNVLLGFAILLFLVYLGYEVKNVLSPPALIIDYPPNHVEISKNFIEVIGSTDHEAQIKINDQEILRNADGGFKEMINLKNGVNIIKITAKNNHGKEKIEYREVMVIDEKMDDEDLSLK